MIILLRGAFSESMDQFYGNNLHLPYGGISIFCSVKIGKSSREDQTEAK